MPELSAFKCLQMILEGGAKLSERACVGLARVLIPFDNSSPALT